MFAQAQQQGETEAGHCRAGKGCLCWPMTAFLSVYEVQIRFEASTRTDQLSKKKRQETKPRCSTVQWMAVGDDSL